MDIINIETKLITGANINLRFADDTESDYTISMGDMITISYIDNGSMKTAVGKVIDIIPYVTNVSLNRLIPFSKSIVQIKLDCSKENESNIISIQSTMIRGINDTSEKYKEPEPIDTSNASSTTVTTPLNE